MRHHPEYGFLHTIVLCGGEVFQAYVRGFYAGHYYIRYACVDGRPMGGCGFTLLNRGRVESMFITRGC